MNEKQMEDLEKMFPEGFVIVFRRSAEDKKESEGCGMYLFNPKESDAIFRVANQVLDTFEESDDEEDPD